MITEKEIIEILEDKLHFKSTIKTLEEELKKTDTATGYCVLRDHIASMKYRLDEIANQIISKLPKLELIAKGTLYWDDEDKQYGLGGSLGTELWIYPNGIENKKRLASFENKNIKIYVEIVDENTTVG